MPIRQGRKITELTALDSASLNTYVVGVDNNVTYKMSLDVLENAIINLATSSTNDRLNNLEQSTSSFFTEKNSNPSENNFVAVFGEENTLQKGAIFVTGSRVIIGGPSASQHPFVPEALAVYSQLDGYNLISGHGNTNNYLQLNVKNFSNLSNASSDIVATADNGDEESFYVNMGINGSGYDEDTIIGRANDTYVYGYGNVFHIGNAAEEPVIIFAGGFDARGENLKMVIDPNDNHTLTGSLSMSGSLNVFGNQNISGTIQLYDVTGTSNHIILLQQDSDGTISISNGKLVPADGIRIPGGQVQMILKNDASSEYDAYIENVDGIGLKISSSGAVDSIMELSGYSLNVSNTLTASIDEGYIWVGDFNNKTNLVPTSSFAVTGSNTFIGKQVLQDESTNLVTIYPFSGSLILIADSYNSESNHISVSSKDFINLIFKDSNVQGSTIISGSNNLIKNPNLPNTGFVNYIKDSNISLQGHLPQISSSMQFPIDVNGNILNGHSNVIMRGPSSATYWTINGNYVAGSTNGISIGTSTTNNAEKLVGQLTINNNVIQNSLQIVANNRPIQGVTMISSNNILGNAILNLYGDAAVLFTQNYVNGTNQFTTNYSSGSTTTTIISATRNTFAGNSNNVLITGSYVTGSTTLSVVDNATFGASNTLYLNAETQLAYKDYLRTIVAGSNLIVSGSNWANDTNNAGTIVLGRNNANDGIRNKTRENILIVGTGTSTTNRKTGLLIDSGSNMFVEGSFNLSGSMVISGSQYISGSIILSNGAIIKDNKNSSIAFGEQAAEYNQGTQSVAIGQGAGNYDQNNGAVAVGANAGGFNQGLRATAIGSLAGGINQGEYAVAIGNFAGGTDQASNSIIINATGTSLDNTITSSLKIAPIRNITGTGILQYNDITKEVSYSNIISGSTTFVGINRFETVGGDEGGEIEFGVPETNTTLSTRVVTDIYQNRFRIFDGNTKGVFIDLSKAPTGVAGELTWKSSGIVNAGTFVSLDNIKVTVTSSGNRGLSVGAVSTSFTANVGGTYSTAIPSSGGASANNVSYTTTASTSAFGWNFGSEGDTSTYIITDKTNSRVYRVTLMIGASYNNNFISIERLH